MELYNLQGKDKQEREAEIANRITESTRQRLQSIKGRLLSSANLATSYEIGMQYMGKAHLWKAGMKLAGAAVMAATGNPLATSVLLAGAGKDLTNLPITLAGRVVENFTSAPRSYILHQGFTGLLKGLTDKHRTEAERQMIADAHTFADEVGMHTFDVKEPYQRAKEVKRKLRALESDDRLLKEKAIREWQEKVFRGEITDRERKELVDSAMRRLQEITDNPDRVLQRLQNYTYNPVTQKFLDENYQDVVGYMLMLAEMKKEFLRVFDLHLYQKGQFTKVLGAGLAYSEGKGKEFANTKAAQQALALGAAGMSRQEARTTTTDLGNLATGQHGGITRNMYQRDLLGRYLSMYGRFHKTLAVQMVTNIFDTLDKHLSLRDAMMQDPIYGTPNQYVPKILEQVRVRDQDVGIETGKQTAWGAEYDSIRLAGRYAMMGAAFGTLSVAAGSGLYALLGWQSIDWEWKERLEQIGRYSGLQTVASQSTKLLLETLFTLLAIDADNLEDATITPTQSAKAHTGHVAAVTDLFSSLGNGKTQSQALTALIGIGLDMAYLGARGYGNSAGEQLGMNEAMRKAQAQRINNLLAGIPFISTAYEYAKPAINTVATASQAMEAEKRGNSTSEDISITEVLENTGIYPEKFSEAETKAIQGVFHRQKAQKKVENR